VGRQSSEAGRASVTLTKAVAEGRTAGSSSREAEKNLADEVVSLAAPSVSQPCVLEEEGRVALGRSVFWIVEIFRLAKAKGNNVTESWVRGKSYRAVLEAKPRIT